MVGLNDRYAMLTLGRIIASAQRGGGIEWEWRTIRTACPYTLVATLTVACVDFRCVRNVTREALRAEVPVTLSHVERLVTPVGVTT